MGTPLVTILLLIVTIAQPMAQDISSKFPYESKYINVRPKEIPFDGMPEETHIVISNYALWLRETDVPMLFLYAKPGMIIK